MMNIGIFLVTPQERHSSLSIIVTEKGKRYKRAVGQTVETQYWDQARQCCRVAAKYRDVAIVANEKIDKLKSAVKVIADKPAKDAKHFWAMVDAVLDGRPYSDVNPEVKFLTAYIEEVFIPKFKDTKSEVRILRFGVVLHMIQKYEKSKQLRLTFDDINTVFYRNFQQWMQEQNYSVNYFGSIIKVLKQMMREARVIDHLHTNEETTSGDFKATTADTDSVYLTVDELLLIHATALGDAFLDAFYPRSGNHAREHILKSYNSVKNRFLIGAFTGLRVSDFNRLDAQAIIDGKIHIITQKTGAKVIIPLHRVVREILDGGFDFATAISEQKTRLYIKDICKFLKINELVEVRVNEEGRTIVVRKPKYELVGTHTARRSFATNAYLAGIPPVAIMKITGHTKESTFMKYIRISQQENADILAEHAFFK